MAQEIKKIPIWKLKLWTENPRDGINASEKNKFDDFEILKKALGQNKDKWELVKLAKKMGEHYDFSEIPTVVADGNYYVVYDGNRRLAIIKYLQNSEWRKKIEEKIILKNPDNFKKISEIPCNVCDKDTALINVERKHIGSGSWTTLDREYFLNIHASKPASIFLTIEKQTKIISKNSKIMDKRFVKEEVLTKENLNKIGFGIKNGNFISNYDSKDSDKIIEKIIMLIKNKEITTRKNRKKLKETLQKECPDLKIQKFNEQKKQNLVNLFKCKKIN